MRASTVGDGAPRSAAHRGRKRPFRVGTVVRRVREAVRPLTKAAMFAPAEAGHVARRLFAVAPTPAALAVLPVGRIDRLVGDTVFRVEPDSLLVPFGTHICAGRLPRCSTCPLLDMCRQVGVEANR